MDGEAIFFTGQGGAGRGQAKNLWGGEPLPPHSAGRGREGVKICGAGRARGREHTIHSQMLGKVESVLPAKF